MEANLELNDKLCHSFGRVIIVGPSASSEGMTKELHYAALQVIPILFNLPGHSIEIEQKGKIYRVTHRLDKKGRNAYHVEPKVASLKHFSEAQVALNNAVFEYKTAGVRL